MSEIKTHTHIFTNRVTMHWKCDHCRFSLSYFDQPKEIESFLEKAMQFALEKHIREEHAA